MRKLTEHERSMIIYFHKERGDLTRWTEWRNVQPILERWHPELLKAIKDRDVAEKILDHVVDAL